MSELATARHCARDAACDRCQCVTAGQKVYEVELAGEGTNPT
jgi:hypothetical protein